MRPIVIVLMALAMIPAAYGDDKCVKESVSFANCVDNALVASRGKRDLDAQQLTDLVFKTCAEQTKDYVVCGGINKDEFAETFVRLRIDKIRPGTTAAAEGTPSETNTDSD